MSALIRGLGWLAGLAAALIIGFAIWVWWNDRAVSGWCEGLAPGTAYSEALRTARDAGLALPWLDSDGEARLIAFNHLRAAGQLACEARFEDGALIGKRLISGN